MPEDQLTLLPPPFLYYFIPNPNTQYKGGLYLNAKFCYSMGGEIFKNVLFLINNCLGGMSILLLSHTTCGNQLRLKGSACINKSIYLSGIWLLSGFWLLSGIWLLPGNHFLLTFSTNQYPGRKWYPTHP